MLEAFRKDGHGWQSRINAALREWIAATRASRRSAASSAAATRKAGDDHRAFLFTSPEAARKMIAAAASGRPLNVSAARTISMNAAPRPRIYFLKIGSDAWIVAAVMPGFLSSAS